MFSSVPAERQRVPWLTSKDLEVEVEHFDVVALLRVEREEALERLDALVLALVLQHAEQELLAVDLHLGLEAEALRQHVVEEVVERDLTLAVLVLLQVLHFLGVAETHEVADLGERHGLLPAEVRGARRRTWRCRARPCGSS